MALPHVVLPHAVLEEEVEGPPHTVIDIPPDEPAAAQEPPHPAGAPSAFAVSSRIAIKPVPGRAKPDSSRKQTVRRQVASEAGSHMPITWLVSWRRRQHDRQGWASLPTELLTEIVRHAAAADPSTLRTMHPVCRAWRDAVRANTTAITLSKRAQKALSAGRLAAAFPALSSLALGKMRLDEAGVRGVARLPQLKSLSLNLCLFGTDSRPALLSHLQALTSLTSLEMADVVGPSSEDIDSLLAALPQLQALRLRKRHVVTVLPSLCALSKLTALHTLAVADVQHRHMLTGLTGLARLPNLRCLALHKVGVTNSVLRGLSQTLALQELSIPDAFRVTDAGLGHLAQLSALTALDLSASPRRDEDITDAGLAHLSELRGLQKLVLAGQSALTPGALAWLSDATALTHLDLSFIQLYPEGAAFLQPLTRMRHLNLAHTHLSQEQLGTLAGLSCLAELDLDHSQLHDSAVGAITHLSRLTRLSLSYCALTNAGILQVSQSCRQLRHFDMDGCRVSVLGVARVFYSHPNIRLWPKGRDKWPRWVYVLDTLLWAVPAPQHRRVPRQLFAPESSFLLNVAVGTCILLGGTVYYGTLALLFTCFVIIPFFLLVLLASIVGVIMLGLRWSYRGLRALHGRAQQGVAACLARLADCRGGHEEAATVGP